MSMNKALMVVYIYMLAGCHYFLAEYYIARGKFWVQAVRFLEWRKGFAVPIGDIEMAFYGKIANILERLN